MVIIRHAHIPPQHMLIFATRMGNMSMFSKLCFFNRLLNYIQIKLFIIMNHCIIVQTFDQIEI